MKARIKKFDFRILITGYFNSGKTTLIHTLDPDAISIEKEISEQTKKRINLDSFSEKTHTTTGFDRGILCWARPNLNDTTCGILMSLEEYEREKESYLDWHIKFIELKGVPGQLHFSVVRKMLSKDAQGILFLIDGCDLANIGNALTILEETRFNLRQKPMVCVANKSDRKDYQGEDFISDTIGEKVYSASALENIGCKDAIIKILKEIEINSTAEIPNQQCELNLQKNEIH